MTFTREVLSNKLEGSLKRLGTDYIDLYLLHGPDDVTPASSIAESMDTFVRAGKIRYWGVSNHCASMVAQFVESAKERKDKPSIAGLEDYYNIIGAERRTFMDREMFPLIREGHVGLMAFSPLAEGRLAPSRVIEPGSPLAAVVSELDRVAKEIGVTRPQVCIAWVAVRSEVTTVLAGAEKINHVEENWKGAYLSLPVEAVTALNAASDAYTESVSTLSK